MLLNNITFPVYKLPAHIEITTNSLDLLIMRTERKEWVLDQPNLEGTFFSRRIKLKTAGRDVYPLKQRQPTFSYLIKFPSGTTFMDSNGAVFAYHKFNKYWKLSYYKICKMELYNSGTIVECKELNVPFYFQSIINTNNKYMGVLEKNGMYAPYDFSVKKLPDTRRMV